MKQNLNIFFFYISFNVQIFFYIFHSYKIAHQVFFIRLSVYAYKERIKVNRFLLTVNLFIYLNYFILFLKSTRNSRMYMKHIWYILKFTLQTFQLLSTWFRIFSCIHQLKTLLIVAHQIIFFAKKFRCSYCLTFKYVNRFKYILFYVCFR